MFSGIEPDVTEVASRQERIDARRDIGYGGQSTVQNQRAASMTGRQPRRHSSTYRTSKKNNVFRLSTAHVDRVVPGRFGSLIASPLAGAASAVAEARVIHDGNGRAEGPEKRDGAQLVADIANGAGE